MVQTTDSMVKKLLQRTLLERPKPSQAQPMDGRRVVLSGNLSLCSSLFYLSNSIFQDAANSYCLVDFLGRHCLYKDNLFNHHCLLAPFPCIPSLFPLLSLWSRSCQALGYYLSLGCRMGYFSPICLRNETRKCTL